jgi:hypothetical protein
MLVCMEFPRAKRPGDVFLDRYMSNASVEEREAARENLRRFARLILRICTRIAEEEHEARIRAQADADVVSDGT